MNELLQPDAGVAAATTRDLDAWDAEGGAPGVSLPAGATTVAAVPKAQRWLLERLGAALVAEWHRLPTPLQRALYNRAVAGDPVRHGLARRRRMARFLHDHKSPDNRTTVLDAQPRPGRIGPGPLAMEQHMKNALESVQAAYTAFAKGDIPTVLAMFAPDIRWTEPEGGPFGGVSIGPDAVVQDVFMKLGGEWDGFAVVPREFVADGDTVVALGECSGTFKATGKSFSAPFAHAWKFQDGKAVSFQQYTDTALQMRPLSAG